MGFDTNKWFKRQYLMEASLLENEEADKIHDLIYDANPSYSNLAKALAKFLKGTEEDLDSGFSSDQIKDFMKILHAELGIDKSVNEDKENLGKEFSDKFDVPASSDEDSITIRTKDIIEDPTAERMIDWIESKGYIVDKKRSSFDYDYEPGERDFWPRIRFNKK
jgi:hypothetical protein